MCDVPLFFFSGCIRGLTDFSTKSTATISNWPKSSEFRCQIWMWYVHKWTNSSFRISGCPYQPRHRARLRDLIINCRSTGCLFFGCFCSHYWCLSFLFLYAVLTEPFTMVLLQVLESMDRSYLVASQTDQNLQQVSSQFRDFLRVDSMEQNSSKVSICLCYVVIF